MSLIHAIKSNPRLKRFVHWCLIPQNQARPRKWVQWFVNPFIHRRGKGSVVCRRTRMDILPFQSFSIGKNSTIEDFATINNGVGPVQIGDETRIGIGNVVIGPVTIGNHVILAQNIVMSGLNHMYTDIHVPIHLQPVTTAPIVIEDECWIGANAVITAGVTIGKHSVVAAGAVVTKDIPPYSVAVGNPARVIKRYNIVTETWERI
jgi:acetyltransferase-like isoleucine patch superfamily enzyme